MTRNNLLPHKPVFDSHKNLYLYDMPTLTVKIPEDAQAQFTEFVKQLGGEVVSIKNSKAEKKAKLLVSIREGLQEVKAIREGKLKSFTMDDLLNGE